MIKKTLISLVLAIVGALLIVHGSQESRNDPTRGHLRMQGRILEHRISLNQQRWKDAVADAMELETRLEIPDSPSGPSALVIMREYFSTGEKASRAPEREPVGTEISCLVSPDLKEVTRSRFGPSGAQWTMIIGSLLMVVALVLFLPVQLAELGSTLFAVGFFLAFLAAGVGLAWRMWPDVITHIRAAKWDAASYQRSAQRTMGSGKSAHREFVIRYTAAGRGVETVALGDDGFGFREAPRSAGGELHVNPADPWQVAFSWGWRPGLGLGMLFPIPFLAVGTLLFWIPFSPGVRRQLRTRERWEDLPKSPWEEALGAGFAVLFVGSIVGAFVSVCAEAWMQQQAMRWFLTLFLIPFVYWFGQLVLKFAKCLRRAL